MADFEAWLVFLILVVNVVGELQRKRTLAASRGFLAAARLSCYLSVSFRTVASHVVHTTTARLSASGRLSDVVDSFGTTKYSVTCL